MYKNHLCSGAGVTHYRNKNPAFAQTVRCYLNQTPGWRDESGRLFLIIPLPFLTCLRSKSDAYQRPKKIRVALFVLSTILK